MKKLYLNIVSPEKEIYNGEVESVTLPGTIGTFTILPQHAPIVSSLREGKVMYVSTEGEEQTLDIEGGFIELSGGLRRLTIVFSSLILLFLILNNTMSISLTKRNFLYQITLLTLIAGWVGAGILHYLLPGHYFGGYPFIPVYFFLFGLFEISMFDACRKHAPQKMLLLYMAMKVMKMLLSVILLVVYCFAVREEAKLFLLTFILYYIVYLIYETWFFFTYEVGKKQKKEKKNETNA